MVDRTLVESKEINLNFHKQQGISVLLSNSIILDAWQGEDNKNHSFLKDN